jgi:hypothetical protein
MSCVCVKINTDKYNNVINLSTFYKDQNYNLSSIPNEIVKKKAVKIKEMLFSSDIPAIFYFTNRPKTLFKNILKNDFFFLDFVLYLKVSKTKALCFSSLLIENKYWLQDFDPDCMIENIHIELEVSDF